MALQPCFLRNPEVKPPYPNLGLYYPFELPAVWE